MGKYAFFVAIVTLLGFWQTAFGQTQVLGYELGKTSVQEFKSSLNTNVRLERLGVNRYSDGEMYRVPGAPYGIEGLKDVLVVFDASGSMSALIMTMQKNKFEDVRAALGSKYRQVQSTIPFVGNRLVVYASRDSRIELDSPHMSFELTVTYMKNELHQKFRSQLQKDAEAKRRSEASRF